MVACLLIPTSLFLSSGSIGLSGTWNKKNKKIKCGTSVEIEDKSTDNLETIEGTVTVGDSR